MASDVEIRYALHKFAHEVQLANRHCLAAYEKACAPQEVRGPRGTVRKMGKGEGLPSLRRRCQVSMGGFRRLERALWGYLQVLSNPLARRGWETLLRKRVKEVLVVCRSGGLHEAYSSLAMPVHLPPLDVPFLSLEESQQALQRGMSNEALTPAAIRELMGAAKAEADRVTCDLRSQLARGPARDLSANTLGLLEAAVKRDNCLAGLWKLLDEVTKARVTGVADA